MNTAGEYPFCKVTPARGFNSYTAVLNWSFCSRNFPKYLQQIFRATLDKLINFFTLILTSDFTFIFTSEIIVFVKYFLV